MEFKEKLFLFLAGIFLTSLVLGNVIGTTKFVQVFFMTVPAGVLAYPFTFLATDLICELYGKKRAQTLVWIGFIMNFFMLGLMTLGHLLQDASGVSGAASTFENVYRFMVGNTIASMIAYLVAQTIDVHLFHFWKRLTKGKHLWLRNNLSTTFSQLVDTTAILSILYFANNLGDNVNSLGALFGLIVSSYLFKFFFALFDTPLFYLGVWLLKDKVHEDPDELVWGYRGFKKEAL
ncbi:MAG: queuosine precursor transporter [Candidatus Marinimicrobia bacterium]|nr:queuosine precursor transporter [Candidatus Neomarinimicrobiota bacterium]